MLVVNINDPVWKTPTVEVARIRQGSKEETRQRQAELKLQLDHLRDVGHVLNKLSEAGLHLKPSKYSFA